MIPGFHGFDLIVILVVALLIFGPKRLPEMGASIGKSIKAFRKGMEDINKPDKEPDLPVSNKDLNRLSATSINEPVFESDRVRETVTTDVQQRLD